MRPRYGAVHLWAFRMAVCLRELICRFSLLERWMKGCGPHSTRC